MHNIFILILYFNHYVRTHAYQTIGFYNIIILYLKKKKKNISRFHTFNIEPNSKFLYNMGPRVGRLKLYLWPTS